MKKTKKNPKANLENYSKLFLQLGLVLSLFVAYIFIEQKTEDKKYEELPKANMVDNFLEINPDIERPKPITPKVKPRIVMLPKIVEDDDILIEDVFKSTEPIDDEPTSPVEEIPIDEHIVEDVPIILIEEAPVFPGCKGDRNALIKCFNKKIQKHFSRKFDNELPNELGLSAGKKRVHIGFKIDKFGNVIDIQALAPHPKIKKEVLKVMKLLPKMKPGKQQGVAVGVKYSIPLKILVE